MCLSLGWDILKLETNSNPIQSFENVKCCKIDKFRNEEIGCLIQGTEAEICSLNFSVAWVIAYTSPNLCFSASTADHRGKER